MTNIIFLNTYLIYPHQYFLSNCLKWQLRIFNKFLIYTIYIHKIWLYLSDFFICLQYTYIKFDYILSDFFICLCFRLVLGRHILWEESSRGKPRIPREEFMHLLPEMFSSWWNLLNIRTWMFLSPAPTSRSTLARCSTSCPGRVSSASSRTENNRLSWSGWRRGRSIVLRSVQYLSTIFSWPGFFF